MSIVKVFRYKKRLCVILSKTINNINVHNGYVEILKKGYSEEYYLNHYLSEEITFVDYLKEFGEITFVGFDTLHLKDTPETQSLEAVTKRTLNFAKEVCKRRL